MCCPFRSSTGNHISMNKKINSALISVFYKDGLLPLVETLKELGVTIYSTGGTQQFIEEAGALVVPVEDITGYPAILGGRVKTLHPGVFGGILGKRADETHLSEMKEHLIPKIDLVVVDLYPFEETVQNLLNEGKNLAENEAQIIEKIDIGGPSMLRAAAKNHADVTVIAAKEDYQVLADLLKAQDGETTLDQRRQFAIKAFDVCTHYDNAISNYFHGYSFITPFSSKNTPLRYGENPHQAANFYGDLQAQFEQLNGKELSYNNLVDVDAAVELMNEFFSTTFAIIKHTNVCGIAQAGTVQEAWHKALAGDPESAFGGVLITNAEVDADTASAINELFFEVLVAPSFSPEALKTLRSKKNRILLRQLDKRASAQQFKTLLGGVLVQQTDKGNYEKWENAGGRPATIEEDEDLKFANLVCKHLKSNAIAIVKNKQLLGKGCGQTSRVDALRHALEKARQFDADLGGAVLASDAFFPFDDCVKIAHGAGIVAFVQPGGSIRDKDSIDYCIQNNLAMVLTGTRHFKH